MLERSLSGSVQIFLLLNENFLNSLEFFTCERVVEQKVSVAFRSLSRRTILLSLSNSHGVEYILNLSDLRLWIYAINKILYIFDEKTIKFLITVSENLWAQTRRKTEKCKTKRNGVFSTFHSPSFNLSELNLIELKLTALRVA
jgi:hypothetical protein